MSAGDTAWVLVSTALVALMVPGLALFYGGLVRSRSALNTMISGDPLDAEQERAARNQGWAPP